MLPGIDEMTFGLDMCKRVSEIRRDVQIMQASDDTELVEAVNQEMLDDKVLLFIGAAAIGHAYTWMMAASGTGALISAKASVRTARSRLFADILTAKVSQACYFRNKGVRDRTLYLLDQTNCPAVFLEVGYLTHPHDATVMSAPYWRNQVACAIVDSTYEYQRRLCEPKD